MNEKKVWEEEWELDDYGGLHVWVNGEPAHVAEFNDQARAKFAGQAPAMARLLLELRGLCETNQNGWQVKQIDYLLRAAGVLP